MARNLLIPGLLVSMLGAAPGPLETAESLYRRTSYAQALDTLAAVEPKGGPVHDLIGRCHYMLGDFKKASESLENAAAADPGNSMYRLWLGRAYGRRAEKASMLSAPGLASKTRKHFEAAVDLNPRNLDALNDLFEYYLEAPGFLGGGVDKAAAIANRVRELDPVGFHVLQSRLAERRKDYAQAESELRSAAGLAPRQVGRQLDLAKFYARRGRFAESEEAFANAARLAPGDPRILYDRASTYIRGKRNLEQARELLQRYLNATLTPDLPGREEARQLLKRAQGG